MLERAVYLRILGIAGIIHPAHAHAGSLEEIDVEILFRGRTGEVLIGADFRQISSRRAEGSGSRSSNPSTPEWAS